MDNVETICNEYTFLANLGSGYSYHIRTHLFFYSMSVERRLDHESIFLRSGRAVAHARGRGRGARARGEEELNAVRELYSNRTVHIGAGLRAGGGVSAGRDREITD